MNPTVSLLIPVFNRADLLGQAIDSALAQTFDDLEVVVVDGASTDRSWEVCLRYAEADRRVRIFRDPVNTGPVRGWIRCVAEARGKYGTFLWSDDVLMPTFVERTTHYLGDDRVAFSYTAARIGLSPESGRLAYRHDMSLIPSEDFIRDNLRTRGRYPLSPACAMFRLDDIRRDLLLELPTDPPFDLSSTGAGSDVLLYLLAAARRPSVCHIPLPLAFFRAHPGSITVDGRGGQVALSYATAKVWFAQTHGMTSLVPRILAWHWLDQMRSKRRPVMPLRAVAGTPATSTAQLLVAAIALTTGTVLGWIRASFSRSRHPAVRV